jgi:hypothetical protein
MTKYANHNSKEKIRSRRKIYREVVRNVKYRNKLGKVNVLTLPSTNFALEKELVKLNNVDLVCVEKERDVYMYCMDKSVTKAYYLGDVFDYLSLEYIPVFDVIWLDLCAPLSFRIINDFISLIQGDKIASGATVALTVMATRENEWKELSKVYNCDSLEEFRDKVFPDTVIEFAKMSGKKCKLKEIFSYKTTTLMKMYLFTIK